MAVQYNEAETQSYTNFVIIGDSLSDRGSMYNRKFAGVIPLKIPSGLNKSPKGRFTNGYNWNDVLFTMLKDYFDSQQTDASESETGTSLGLNKSSVVRFDSYRSQLKDHRVVKYKGTSFARVFAEGGASAYKYHFKPFSKSSYLMFLQREIVKTSEDLRKALLKDDRANHVSKAEKSQTLVMQCLGANDMLTVNRKPTEKKVKKAIKGTYQNIEKMMEHGYKHFVVFTLPDLSLTPRFHRKSEKSRANAKKCTASFNDKLFSLCDRLQADNPSCIFEVFDINEIFTEVYYNPEKYGFDPDKLTQSYLDSKDYVGTKDNGESAKFGYMFWDDVHPMQRLHKILAQNIFEQYCDQIEIPSETKTDYQYRTLTM